MPRAKPRPGSIRSNESLDLETLLGSTWQGFFLKGDPSGQGQLQHLMWRRAFDAGELCALFYRCQQVTALEYQAERLQRELESAQAELEKAEKQLQFYRHELRAASRLGLMFSDLDSAR